MSTDALPPKEPQPPSSHDPLQKLTEQTLSFLCINLKPSGRELSLTEAAHYGGGDQLLIKARTILGFDHSDLTDPASAHELLTAFPTLEGNFDISRLFENHPNSPRPLDELSIRTAATKSLKPKTEILQQYSDACRPQLKHFRQTILSLLQTQEPTTGLPPLDQQLTSVSLDDFPIDTNPDGDLAYYLNVNGARHWLSADNSSLITQALFQPENQPLLRFFVAQRLYDLQAGRVNELQNYLSQLAELRATDVHETDVINVHARIALLNAVLKHLAPGNSAEPQQILVYCRPDSDKDPTKHFLFRLDPEDSRLLVSWPSPTARPGVYDRTVSLPVFNGQILNKPETSPYSTDLNLMHQIFTNFFRFLTLEALAENYPHRESFLTVVRHELDQIGSHSSLNDELTQFTRGGYSYEVFSGPTSDPAPLLPAYAPPPHSAAKVFSPN